MGGFGPLLPGFDQVELDDIEAVKAAIGAETAAIMIEPIQGEGGIRVVPGTFLRELRQLCDEHGLLLILDEIQCGMGRTGTLFAHEHAGITPDIMGVAKGIGGGFPLGACLATEEAAAGMAAGTHGSTYGGNPLACAVGNAVVEEIARPEFLEEVKRKAGLLRQRLGALADEHSDIIAEVRGEGLPASERGVRQWRLRRRGARERLADGSRRSERGAHPSTPEHPGRGPGRGGGTARRHVPRSESEIRRSCMTRHFLDLDQVPAE